MIVDLIQCLSSSLIYVDINADTLRSNFLPTTIRGARKGLHLAEDLCASIPSWFLFDAQFLFDRSNLFDTGFNLDVGFDFQVGIGFDGISFHISSLDRAVQRILSMCKDIVASQYIISPRTLPQEVIPSLN